MTADEIHAAGVVLYRHDAGELLVAVAHRSRYDDWSLPKGKLEPGESAVCAAVRETAEETGAVAVLTRRLPSVRYRVGAQRKVVDYWLARSAGGAFVANDEVDELAWLTVPEALARVSYDGDRTTLTSAIAAPIPEAVVVLVRHARAGKRSAWKGEDALRPLDRGGAQQASRLASSFLPLFAPRTVISAEPVRCRQTAEPFARALGLPMTIEERFGDDGFAADPDGAVAALLELGRPGGSTLVISQGAALPGLLERVWAGYSPQQAPDTKKGHAWVLSFADGKVIAADHYPGAARSSSGEPGTDGGAATA